jgi:hypothetical protein
MNRRSIVWLALFTLGIAAVLTAVSAAADPADLNNPPTEDWFFDSGNNVTISNKVWDINYNITVANYTTLNFDQCTFTFSDPDNLYARWINVWWNGTMTVTDCTFKSTGTVKYYIMLNNDTTFQDSTISDMVPFASGEGGITAWNADLTFIDTTLKDTPDYHALVTYRCDVTMDGFSVSNAGSLNNGRAAVWLEWRGTGVDESYHVVIKNSAFDNNIEDGIRFSMDSNYADFTFDITDCSFSNNGQDGIEWRWSWGRNSTFETTFTRCSFKENHNRGIYFDGYRHNYDGSAMTNLTFDTCVFEGNNDGGAYVYQYDHDGQFNLVVKACTFTDNGLTPVWWAFGGMYVQFYRFYGMYTIDVDNCLFDNNAVEGLYIFQSSAEMEGSWISVTESTFTDNQDHGVIVYVYDYYDHLADMTFDQCTFTDNGDAGLFIQHESIWDQDYTLDVTDCSFSGGGGGILSHSWGWSDGGMDIYWNVADSTFTGLGDMAVSLFLVEVGGDTGLTIDNCDINDTGGVSYKVLGSLSDVQPYHYLSITDTDIADSVGSGVDAHMVGYYGVELDVYMKNVDVTDALFNGIKTTTATDFGSSSNTIDMDIDLMDVTVTNIGGNGLNLGNERVDYAGTRTINLDGVSVANTQKAMVISSLKGEFRNTSITNSLKQDLVVITSDLELFQPTLDKLDSSTVQVIESGSVKFWYTLKVYVNWDTGAAVEGAVVEITDNQHTLISARTQADDTGLPELLLNSFQFRETGQFTRSPYVLHVTFRAIEKTVAVNLDEDKIVTINLADHVPPQVFIVTPGQDHIQKDTVIEVRGSSFDTESDVDMVEVSIDGVTWVQTATTIAWDHTFTVTVQDVIDNGGVFTIRARATDMAGNSATTFTSLEIDPFPPELRVDHPIDGMQTNERTITVRGVTELGAMVMVNGEEVVVIGTLFQASVDLVEGPNTITVEAFDALGNSMDDKMEVVLDTKPPYLVLLTPVDGEMFTEPTATVSGQAEDGLVIKVNGNKLGDAHYDNGTFEYAVSLSRGENMISIMATDLAGNDISLMRTVLLDDVPPVLAIQSPMDGMHQNSMDIIVVGTTDVDATLLINANTISLDHGLFAYTFVGVEGENVVLIVTSDTAGNTVSASLSVFIDTVGPSVEITGPASDDEMVTDETFVIEGTADGGAFVWVNGEKSDITDGAFAVPVILLEGENRFIITIEDLAGNSITENRFVTLDTQPPLLVVRIPDLIEKDDGKIIFKTKKGKPSTMTIVGFTDDAVQIRINGVLAPVSTEGYFTVDYLLDVNSPNTITIVATDAAGNEETWTGTVEHNHLPDDKGDTFDWGLLILVVGLILLAIAIILGRKRLSAVEEEQEIRVEEDEVLAPAALPEVEEEEEEIEEEEEDLLIDEEEEEDLLIDEEDEEVHELTPPSERPRTDTSRPAYESSEEVTIEIDEKDLEEKDAEADVEADESEQEEGI